MFAIVTISGKQYRVKKGNQIKVANLKKNVGDKIKFEKVLLIEDSNTLTVGDPNINGATVSGTVLENGRDRKIIIFKKNVVKDIGGKMVFDNLFHWFILTQ